MIASTLLTLLLAGIAAPQEPPRWQAFEGCWRPEADHARAAPAALWCIRENGEGVTIGTYAEAGLQSERQLVADGSARPVTEAGCSGSEVTRWSTDGRRVYVRAELTCGEGTRTLVSVLALVDGASLVAVQSLRAGENSSVRSVRYQALPATEYPAGFALAPGHELARETARLLAASPLTLPAVIEGAQQLDAGALNALLAARGAGFDLDLKAVRRLASAGVARATLDVMVALSYPKEFRVAAAAPPPRAPGVAAAYPAYDPFARDSWRLSYDGYSNCFGLNYYSLNNYPSYACNYLYAYLYGYPSRYGGDPYGGYYGTGEVYVVPTAVGVAARPDRGGGGSVSRAGFSRGTSMSLGTAQPRAPGFGSTSARAVSVGVSTASSNSTWIGGMMGGGGGSSGGGSVSGSGYSSTSGTSTGQTAVPREQDQ